MYTGYFPNKRLSQCVYGSEVPVITRSSEVPKTLSRIQNQILQKLTKRLKCPDDSCEKWTLRIYPTARDIFRVISDLRGPRRSSTFRNRKHRKNG
jgi:hypothetical protein